jgi:hypothetical protein
MTDEDVNEDGRKHITIMSSSKLISRDNIKVMKCKENKFQKGQAECPPGIKFPIPRVPIRAINWSKAVQFNKTTGQHCFPVPT